MLTQAELKTHVHYDELTGLFTWINPTGKRAKPGEKLGNKMKIGYMECQILGKRYYLHRLAWLYIHGEMTDKHIDHINGDKIDNRIRNLRECNRSQNLQNTNKRSDNTSGYKGVSWSKQMKKWGVRACINGKYKHLGLFQDIEEARQCYERHATQNHGQFYRPT